MPAEDHSSSRVRQSEEYLEERESKAKNASLVLTKGPSAVTWKGSPERYLRKEENN
jgi:hypothetical protein